jgi:hypothetical protein
VEAEIMTDLILMAVIPGVIGMAIITDVLVLCDWTWRFFISLHDGANTP